MTILKETETWRRAKARRAYSLTAREQANVRRAMWEISSEVGGWSEFARLLHCRRETLHKAAADVEYPN